MTSARDTLIGFDFPWDSVPGVTSFREGPIWGRTLTAKSGVVSVADRVVG